MGNDLCEQINKLSINDIPDCDLNKTPQMLFDIFLEKVKLCTSETQIIIGWLCKHPLLTIDVIIDNMDIMWNMDIISMNTGISFESIFEHDDLNWNYNILSMRSDLTSKIIENNISKPWNFWFISTTSLITGKIILQVPYLKHFAQIKVYEDLNYSTMTKTLKRHIFSSECDSIMLKRIKN
jgi:hypothetical protein